MGNVLGHGLLDYFVVFVMTAYAIYAGLTKTHRILYLMPATLSFFFFVDVFIHITPLKIVPFAFLFTVLLTGRKRYVTYSKKNIWPWVVLVLILFYTGIGLYFGSSINALAHYTPAKRLFVQVLSYLSFLVIFHILRKECYNTKRLKLFLDAFVYTTTFLCIYGLYQIIADKVGLPYRGIVYSDETVRSSFVKILGNELFRVNSFANEPKRLSYILIISVIILLGYLRHLDPPKTSRRLIWGLISLHFAMAFMTYSTSLYVALVVYVPLIILASYRHKVHRYYLRYTVLGIIIFGLFFPVFRNQLMALYEKRVREQMAQVSFEAINRIEPYALNYVATFPKKVILGFGPGLYNFEINRAYSHINLNVGLNFGGSLQPMNSAFLTLLFDFGILGPLLIILYPLISLWYSYFNHRSRLSEIMALPILLFIACTAIVLNPIGIFFTFMGAFYGVNH